MSERRPAARSAEPAAPKHRRGPLRRFFKALLRSDAFQTVAARLLHTAMVATYRTNRPVAGSVDMLAHIEGHKPVIIALWHGQQMLVQFTRPLGEPVAGLVSKSADAEINARVLELSGNEVVRGSGGRERTQAARKGGIRALIALREALKRGRHVVMIADISKGSPRQAGEGIVRLAKISGRPIVPLALATSRHHVVARAWDRMTINLPFGHRCLRLGEPIYVPADADEAALAGFRKKVTDDLNRVTEEAYSRVGRTP
ncbi:lysophospholipid acyltransferase family protein [Pararhizobium mangrovi]|uniref:lysophospholipid acyltransferase family protein n=1 Tax=Pararhizobium mangrovi TaxID=2590452 RepID=UPI001F32A423|nr:lysophospholipid acyltransferase family protein [Pararhizobium mangrovi]